ncbi:MAG: hypothetical protein QOE25_168 [Actinomycetota bacterium]|jgi:parallel beta-helix repeat protein|nr:hypothetical protein [Actinomycetota bacterium]
MGGKRFFAAGLFLFVLGLPFAARAAAATIFVDQRNAACVDSGAGAGQRATPYCTINAAAQSAVPGDIVLVATGTYKETVVPRNSGTPAARIVYRAAPGAAVTLQDSSHGFDIEGLGWISVRGFTVTGTSSNGILVRDSTHVRIRYNRVAFSGLPADGSIAAGIRIDDTTDSLIADNTTHHNTDGGIYLVNGSTRNKVLRNTTFSNARGYVRAAPGIDVRSPGNVIGDNIAHDNEDSGIQLYNGANDSVVYDNLAYDNGDHGIDCLNSTGAVIVGNSVYGNTTAGINLEGATGTSASRGGRLANNISVDNGSHNSVGTHGDIRVDANSTPGTAIDRDLVWLSGSGTLIVWGNTSYTSLGTFTAATRQEAHGLQADPRWRDPSAGDFHLTAGSPAIDSADSSAPSEPLFDIEGTTRVDDPGTVNSGTGPRTYDDRGAFELHSSA